jgi:hypothetical protein
MQPRNDAARPITDHIAPIPDHVGHEMRTDEFKQHGPYDQVSADLGHGGRKIMFTKPQDALEQQEEGQGAGNQEAIVEVVMQENRVRKALQEQPVQEEQQDSADKERIIEVTKLHTNARMRRPNPNARSSLAINVMRPSFAECHGFGNSRPRHSSGAVVCSSWRTQFSFGAVKLLSAIFALSLINALQLSAAVYSVGPGQTLSEVDQVPWESLQPGDGVRIHWRPEPYRAKWVLCRRGTAEKRIHIRGVPGPKQELPIIDGESASTRKEINFWGEARAVIKIGGANRPADTMPAFITIEGLEIRNGRAPLGFEGRSGRTGYAKNAAGIYVEKGEQIEIIGCTIHGNGNGIMTGPNVRKLRVAGCSIYGNGAERSIYEHNVYTECQGLIFEFNRFGPLRKLCGGNNFKDRSAGMVFRYNWVEGGNRCLDLVDSKTPAIANDPAYRESLVYGNVLIKGAPPGNNQVVHYGGDSGSPKNYRHGILRFLHNTVVSFRRGNCVAFRLSSANESVDCRNNIFYAGMPGGMMILLAESGNANARNNWFQSGWRFTPGVRVPPKLAASNRSGKTPGFRDWTLRQFDLVSGSPALGAAEQIRNVGSLPASAWAFQYQSHQNWARRFEAVKSRVDLGAFGAGTK